MKSALAAAIAAAVAAADYVPPRTGSVERKEYVCMMQDMVMLKKGVPLTSRGRKYYGCCEMCQAKIKADPARYTTAKDRVTGALVDKSAAYVYALDGAAFYFQTAESRAAFAREPAKYIKDLISP